MQKWIIYSGLGDIIVHLIRRFVHIYFYDKLINVKNPLIIEYQEFNKDHNIITLRFRRVKDKQVYSFYNALNAAFWKYNNKPQVSKLNFQRFHKRAKSDSILSIKCLSISKFVSIVIFVLFFSSNTGIFL
jgi:hypothetical protein